MRLSKQQKKILLCLKERTDKEYRTRLYDIKMYLWGSEPIIHSEGSLGFTIHDRDRLPRYIEGNRYFSVKRSVLNLKDKGLIDIKYDELSVKILKSSGVTGIEYGKLPNWMSFRPKLLCFLTNKGSKCVEDLLHNKKNGGWLNENRR